MSNYLILNKKQVITYYKKHTLNECGIKFKCCSETIKRKLMVWGEKVRTKKESSKMLYDSNSELAKRLRSIRSSEQKEKYKKLGQQMFSKPFQANIGKIRKFKPKQKGKSNGNWKGGKTIHWLRYKTLNRAKGKCEICNWNELSEILEAHHIDMNRSNNKLNNGLAVCPICHRKIHYYNIKSKEEILNKLKSK